MCWYKEIWYWDINLWYSAPELCMTLRLLLQWKSECGIPTLTIPEILDRNAAFRKMISFYFKLKHFTSNFCIGMRHSEKMMPFYFKLKHFISNWSILLQIEALTSTRCKILQRCCTKKIPVINSNYLVLFLFILCLLCCRSRRCLDDLRTLANILLIPPVSSMG